MDRTCSIRGRNKNYIHTILQSENLKGRDYFEELGIYGRVIKNWILYK